MKFLCLSILCLGVLGVSPGLEAQTVAKEADKAPQPRVGVVNLHVGEIDTSDMPNLMTSLPPRFDPGKRYVLQLPGPITREQRESFTSLGIEVEDYIPYYAYIVNLTGVSPAKLTQTGLVHWLGEYPRSWKLQRDIGERTYLTIEREDLADDGRVVVVVSLFRGIPAEVLLDSVTGLGIQQLEVHRIAPIAGNVTVSLTLPMESVGLLADLSEVQFVEEAPEITYRNSTNRWIVQSNNSSSTPLYSNGIHGEGQIVAIMDGRVDRNHCSFSDSAPIGPSHRKIVAYNTSFGADFHGTHVAGTAVGDSGSNNNNRGVAYLAKMVFNSVPSFNETAMYGRLQTHHNQGARVHTNSWGDDGTTSYNSLARGIDNFSHDFEDSLILFAVTNTSTLRNPENCKNGLAVAASLDTPNQGSHCSGGIGPTADGRRKPEIYAPGCSTNSSSANSSCSTTSLTGTSMASPAVAGTAALVRQYYEDGYYPSGVATVGDEINPSGALTKATLINSSVDMTGISGYPSNLEGWGRVHANRSLAFPGDARKLRVIEDRRNASGLSTGEVEEYELIVLGSGSKLMVTCVFTDAPASASTGGGSAAVNDLDLEVISPSSTLYRGNVFSGGVSTTGGSKDANNNVEQVHLSNPQVGTWTVRIRGAAVNTGDQGFALIATGDVDQGLEALRIRYPNGTPLILAAGSSTDIDVTVGAGTENPTPGTETLHYRFGGAGAYQTVSLTPQGGENFTATLPGGTCGDMAEFYVSAQGNGGATVTNPADAPTNVLVSDVGSLATVFADDFEANQGWTIDDSASLTAGTWTRAVPVGGGNSDDPATDFDGSGRCFVTGNDVDEDVDGGRARLISPVLDLSGLNPIVSYARWFSNDGADDTLSLQISGDGGSSYVTVSTVGPGGSGGWVEESFLVSDFITPTTQVRFRFSVTDSPNNSATEAAIDGFEVHEGACNPVGDIADLSMGRMQVDYDPGDTDIDAGPGGLGQAVNVVVTVVNTGNIPVTSADLQVDCFVDGGSVVSKGSVVTDFDPAPGVQSLAPGASADVVYSFVAGELDRCGTYSIVSSHDGANLQAQGGGGLVIGDVRTAGDQVADHPDNDSAIDDSFSPDLLELDFGIAILTVKAVSEIIEDRATEKVKVTIDFTGLGPGMDSHDVRAIFDLLHTDESIAYLNSLVIDRDGVRSSGSRLVTVKIDVSALFPTPQSGAEYKVRMRLRDLNSGETCISSVSSNTTTLQ